MVKASFTHEHLSACGASGRISKMRGEVGNLFAGPVVFELDGMQSLLVAKIDAMRVVRLLVL
jgi:fatty acid-binding protein DegV